MVLTFTPTNWWSLTWLNANMVTDDIWCIQIMWDLYTVHILCILCTFIGPIQKSLFLSDDVWWWWLLRLGNRGLASRAETGITVIVTTPRPPFHAKSVMMTVAMNIVIMMITRSLGTLQAPPSSWRAFEPLYFVLYTQAVWRTQNPHHVLSRNYIFL